MSSEKKYNCMQSFTCAQCNKIRYMHSIKPIENRVCQNCKGTATKKANPKKENMETFTCTKCGKERKVHSNKPVENRICQYCMRHVNNEVKGTFICPECNKERAKSNNYVEGDICFSCKGNKTNNEKGKKKVPIQKYICIECGKEREIASNKPQEGRICNVCIKHKNLKNKEQFTCPQCNKSRPILNTYVPGDVCMHCKINNTKAINQKPVNSRVYEFTCTKCGHLSRMHASKPIPDRVCQACIANENKSKREDFTCPQCNKIRKKTKEYQEGDLCARCKISITLAENPKPRPMQTFTCAKCGKERKMVGDTGIENRICNGCLLKEKYEGMETFICPKCGKERKLISTYIPGDMCHGCKSQMKNREYWDNMSKEDRHEFVKKSCPKRCEYKDQKFDSKPEMELYKYCIENDIEIEREPIQIEYYFDNTRHFYYPDFRINGKIIEVKGGHFFEEQGNKNSNLINPFGKVRRTPMSVAKQECMRKNNVIIITDAEVRQLINNQITLEELLSWTWPESAP